MRHRLATLVAICALGLSVSPALAGSPAVRVSYDATLSGPVACGPTIYTIIAGTFDGVSRVGISASGNVSYEETVRATGVVVQDQFGTSYSVVGARHFQEVDNARTGSAQGIYLFKFQVMGTTDSLNIAMRYMPNGGLNILGPGNCSP